MADLLDPKQFSDQNLMNSWFGSKPFWNLYQDYIGKPFQGAMGYPTGSPPLPEGYPESTGMAPQAGPFPETAAPRGPSLQQLLIGRALAPGPTPPAMDLPQTPTLSAPNVGWPTSPVPQMEQPTTFDRSAIDKYTEMAKPTAPQGSGLDAIIAMLGGAAGGAADFRPGERLGQVIGRAAGGGAPAFVGQRNLDRSRGDAYSDRLSGYYGMRANTEGQLENQRLARADVGQQRTFENKKAVRADERDKLQFDVQLNLIKNEIAKGNYQMATERIKMLRDAGVQDYQLDLMERNLALGLVKAFTSGGTARNLGNLSEGAFIQHLAGKSLSGQPLPLPGYDMSQFMLAAEEQLRKSNPAIFANPNAANMAIKSLAGEMLRNKLVSNPKDFQMLRQMFGNSPLFQGYGMPVEGE